MVKYLLASYTLGVILIHCFLHREDTVNAENNITCYFITNTGHVA
jgi:hypothetical protein